MPAKNPGKRGFAQLARIYGFGAIAVIAAFVLAYQFVEPAPPQVLTMATGRSDGAYHAFAQRYRERLAQDGIELRLRETAGSVENLDLLAAGEVDVAFAQGGTGSRQSGLLALGSLYFEPLWIFVRDEIAGERLDVLAGRRVAWGVEGSGTRAVAQTLFVDADVEVAGVPLSGGEALAALAAGEVDAVMTVAGLNSPTVQKLLLHEEARLLSLARAEGYSRRYRFLSHLSLPAGVLSMRGNRPTQDVELLAPAASLVTGEGLHPALAILLLMAAQEIHDPASALSERGDFPSPELVDFPLSAEAARYYRRGPPLLQRYLPFWAAVLLDRLWVMLLPVIGLMIPLSRILPPTYRWRVRKRIYRWYDELQDMDVAVQHTVTAVAIEPQLRRLDEIEAEVREIEVPLPYGNELYLLRQQIELLRTQFGRREARLREGVESED